MKVLLLLAGCILIFMFIQYAFRINEEFTNNNEYNNYSPSRITFNKIDSTDMGYINTYLPSNSIECLNIKCNLPIDSQNTGYSKYYVNNLNSFTNSEKNKLTEITRNINNSVHFTDINYSIFTEFITQFTNNIKWNILKTYDLELNLPCTLSKCILMPSNIFKTPNWTYIEETLMHEQIHILQRQNQYEFNEFYKRTDIFGDYLVPIKKTDIDFSALEIENIIIANPDEDDYEWIIKDSKKYYVVPYIIPRKSINSHVSTNIAYQIDPETLIVTGTNIPVKQLHYYTYLTSELSNGTHINVAHPNETFTDIFLL